MVEQDYGFAGQGAGVGVDAHPFLPSRCIRSSKTGQLTGCRPWASGRSLARTWCARRSLTRADARAAVQGRPRPSLTRADARAAVQGRPRPSLQAQDDEEFDDEAESNRLVQKPSLTRVPLKATIAGGGAQ